MLNTAFSKQCLGVRLEAVGVAGDGGRRKNLPLLDPNCLASSRACPTGKSGHLVQVWTTIRIHYYQFEPSLGIQVRQHALQLAERRACWPTPERHDKEDAAADGV